MLLHSSGVGIASAALIGFIFPERGHASGERSTATIAPATLEREFSAAAEKYQVPAKLLMAMGYVNTRLEMPLPGASDYQHGEPHNRGSYGIMSLVRNPTTDTLGEAARLTGISVERLKTDRAANILGGAALVADSQGEQREYRARDGSYDTSRWLGAVHGKGGRGRQYAAPAGVGAGELYAGQVDAALKDGFALRLRSGERVVLQGRRAR